MRGTFRCDSLGCIGTVKGKTVALIRHPAALEEDCRLADIVLAPFTIGKKCRAARVIVDRRMLKSEGASALYIEGSRSAPRRSLPRAGGAPGYLTTPS